MKSNRKFVQADDAVSPVIAVILMVAITVVLAATVFVLVSDIGGNKGNVAPAFNLQPDEGANKLVLETAANNADWSRLTVQVDGCTLAGAATTIYMGDGLTPWLSEAADGDGAAITAAGTVPTCGAAAAKQVTATATKMVANEYLAFCVGPDAAAANIATNVKIVIKDTTANTVAYTYTFTDIANCP